LAVCICCAFVPTGSRENFASTEGRVGFRRRPGSAVSCLSSAACGASLIACWDGRN